MAAADKPELLLKDAKALRAWLLKNHTDETGVWLVLAKKGTTDPTSLTYDLALDEMLCFGWVDGQRKSRDDATMLISATRRRARSIWSQRNVGIIERLRSEGRMHAAGEAEVERAQVDGRWDAAYAGSATIEMPHDLELALSMNPAATAGYQAMTKAERYAILFRLHNAKKTETRQRQISAFLDRFSG